MKPLQGRVNGLITGERDDYSRALDNLETYSVQLVSSLDDHVFKKTNKKSKSNSIKWYNNQKYLSIILIVLIIVVISFLAYISY